MSDKAHQPFRISDRKMEKQADGTEFEFDPKMLLIEVGFEEVEKMLMLGINQHLLEYLKSEPTLWPRIEARLIEMLDIIRAEILDTKGGVQ